MLTSLSQIDGHASAVLQRLPARAILAIYLLASSAAATWLPLSEMTKAALAIPALAIVPLLIGLALLQLPVIRDLHPLDGFISTLAAWMMGTIVLVALAVILQLSSQTYLLQRFGLVALALTVGGTLLSYTPSARHLKLGVGGGTALALVPIALLAMTPKLIAIRYTPFPLLSHNFLTPLHFSQPILRMLEHGYLGLENPAHGPGLITLVAIPTQLYESDPLSIFWMGPFLLYAVLGAGLFLWAKAVWGRWTTAVLATAVGIFILNADWPWQSTPLFLRSNTIIFALFPMALYAMHRSVLETSASRQSKFEALIALQASVGLLFLAMNSHRFGLYGQDARVLVTLGLAAYLALVIAVINGMRWRWPGLLALFVVIPGFQMFHVFETPLFLTVLIAYGLALTLRGSLVDAPIGLAAASAAVGYFFLQRGGLISFPSDFSLSSPLLFGSTYSIESFVGRTRALENVLEPQVIVVLVVGVAACLLWRSASKGRAVTVAAAVAFVVYLLPDANTIRAGKVMAPFLALLLVAGANQIGALARIFAQRRGKELPLLQEAMQLGLVAALLPAIFTPFFNFNSSITPGSSHHSSVTDIEYELAAWFDEHTEENVRIISDYQTMLVLSSLSNKISLTERRLLPIEMSDAGREQMRRIKERVLLAPDGDFAYQSIRTLKAAGPDRERRYLEAIGWEESEPRYFVVWTAQTCVWVAKNGIYPTRNPRVRGQVTPEQTPQFNDPRYFEKVAQFGDQAYIFEARPDPGAPAPSPSPPTFKCRRSP